MNDSLPVALVVGGVVVGVFGFARVRAAPTLEARLKALGFYLWLASATLMLSFAAVVVLAGTAPRVPVGSAPPIEALRVHLLAAADHDRLLLSVLAGFVLQLALFVGMLVPVVRDLVLFVREHDADLSGRDMATLAKRTGT